MGHGDPNWTLGHQRNNNSSKSNKKKHNMNNAATTSRTKVNLKNTINYESKDDKTNSAVNLNDRQNQGSVMSNVGTLKPPSPTPPLDPKSAEIGEILETDLSKQHRNQSAETR